MQKVSSRISTDLDFSRDGKQTGFLRLPHSVHRSAYGWIPIPVACLRNGKGPSVLLMAGNHGDEYEGQIAVDHVDRRGRGAVRGLAGRRAPRYAARAPGHFPQRNERDQESRLRMSSS